jgi:hypothetical protein
MLGFLSLFSFDFLALKCFSKGNSAYYDTVYIWCTLPIILTAMMAISLFLFRRGFIGTSLSDSRLNYVKNQHVTFILLLSYLVLPPVLNKQLQVFDCIQVAGDYYLRSDTSVACESDEYVRFSGFVWMFLFIYQLVPITWFVLLYHKRAALNPPTSNYDSRLAMYIRDNNIELTSMRFLFLDYKCNKWWFEIADMYRRIVFVGVVPLVSPNPSTRASFGCLFAILSVAYFREEQPYRVEFTNVIAHIAQVVKYISCITFEFHY